MHRRDTVCHIYTSLHRCSLIKQYFLSTADELARFAKMLKVGIPEGSVRSKMAAEGFDDDMYDKYLNPETGQVRNCVTAYLLTYMKRHAQICQTIYSVR